MMAQQQLESSKCYPFCLQSSLLVVLHQKCYIRGTAVVNRRKDNARYWIKGGYSPLNMRRDLFLTH